MTRVTTDEINQAKQVRLIDFIDANGIDVKQEGKRAEPYYRLGDHDSLVIKGEKFFGIVVKKVDLVRFVLL
ncbi:hypothetical protein [Halalkalibacter lacteus]|uniref:hypothetical protein n=1 Tax=Halalkalibacter lacteus TaxID=3090663 RepID=UPI002FCA081B